MRCWLSASLAVFAFAGPARAAPFDPERAAVVAAVQQFFDGMAANDPKVMADVLVPDGIAASMRPSPGGPPAMRLTPFRQFLEPRTNGDRYLERMWDPVVSRRGSLAVVWAPYEFQLNGKTSHCGVDVFNLVKTDGRWKIAVASWTVEPDACPELNAKLAR